MQEDSLARGIPAESVPGRVLTQNVLRGYQAQDLKECQKDMLVSMDSGDFSYAPSPSHMSTVMECRVAHGLI